MPCLPACYFALPLRPSRIDDEGVREASQAPQPALSPSDSQTPPSVDPPCPCPCPNLPFSQRRVVGRARENSLFPPTALPGSTTPGLPTPFLHPARFPNQPAARGGGGSFFRRCPHPRAGSTNQHSGGAKGLVRFLKLPPLPGPVNPSLSGGAGGVVFLARPCPALPMAPGPSFFANESGGGGRGSFFGRFIVV